MILSSKSDSQVDKGPLCAPAKCDTMKHFVSSRAQQSFPFAGRLCVHNLLTYYLSCFFLHSYGKILWQKQVKGERAALAHSARLW